MTIKEKIIKQITNKVSEALKEIGINDESPISEIPPSVKMGNLAFPMFKYAPVLKKNPVEIADNIFLHFIKPVKVVRVRQFGISNT